MAARTRLSADHHLALAALEGQPAEEFAWELRLAFLHRAAFTLGRDEQGVLTEFQLSKVIFTDGLSKDRLMSDLQALHDANLAGIWTIQRRLGPGGDTWGAANGDEGSSRTGDGLRPEMYG